MIDDDFAKDDPSDADIERFGGETVRCPSCGEEVYDDSPFCPRCGESAPGDMGATRSGSMRATGALLVVSVIVIVVFVLVYVL